MLLNSSIVNYVFKVEIDTFSIEWQVNNFNKLSSQPRSKKIESEIFYPFDGRLALRLSVRFETDSEGQEIDRLGVKIVSPTPAQPYLMFSGSLSSNTGR